jgi:carbon storage regulator CsrA
VLVLTRRLNERILLPGLGVAIGVVSLKPTLVRLGIEAPPHVTVLREEVHRRALSTAPRPADPGTPLEPRLRDRLNAIALDLALLRRQLDRAPKSQLRATVELLEDEFQAFQRELQEVLAEEAGEPPPCPILVPSARPVHAPAT